MLNRQEILSTLKNAKPELEKKYGLTAIALFGSYSRNTQVAGKSDVDVMVEFSEPIGLGFVDLADELEMLLKLKVDLVSRKGIKPKYFKAIEPELVYV
ncbi:MAG: nucleotidyltransferase family protein [Segetibacter sp.]